MSLLHAGSRTSHHPSLRDDFYHAAWLIPFAVYLAAMSSYAYWLDSGEFVAQAIDLDIAHPPGHPLQALLAKLFTLLPIGPLPFRVALFSAACGSAAGASFYRAILTSLGSLAVRSSHVKSFLALSASLLCTLCPAFVFQAVRPEVYALQIALTAAILDRAVRLEAAWPTQEMRPLIEGAFLFGLGLSNHHFLTFLLAPALLPTILRVHRAKGWAPIFASLFAVVIGLLPYVYLPMRSLHGVPLDFGHPANLANFLWVVSAKAYQSSHALTPKPFDLRLLDVLAVLVDNIGLVPLLLSLGASYLIFRTPGAHRVGAIWFGTLMASVLARAFLGFTSNNPDAAGYLLPAILGIVALLVCFAGVVISLLSSEEKEDPRNEDPRPRKNRGIVSMVVAAFALLAVSSAIHGVQSSSLRSFFVTDDIDDVRYRSLPTNAVAFLYVPQTVFRFAALAAEERLRPDVTPVFVPFLAYPNFAERLSSEKVELLPALRSLSYRSALPLGTLQTLAAERPCLVEMDSRLDVSTFAGLSPRNLLFDVLDGGSSIRDIDRGVRRREMEWSALKRVDPELVDYESRGQITMLFFGDALFFAKIGRIEKAREALASALELAPDARELVALAVRLQNAEEGDGIDITPFRPGLE